MSQVIPEGWALAKLDELISYEGVISDGDWVESKDQDPEGSIRLIQLADIGDGEFLNKSNRFMNIASAQRLNCTLLKENDVLIARMPDPLGRACLFPKIENEAVTVVDVCLIRLDDRAGISPKVLMHWINSSVIRNVIALEATGTTRKRITRKKLSHFDFPLPPLAEQKVIADKLDELLAQVESTKARLDAIPAILKSFRQSLLAAAVSGKLTEEWRGDNGCEITQSDIQQAFNRGWEAEKLREYELKGKSPKNDSWKNKLPQPYLPTPEEQKLFDDIPSEWEFVSVNQLTRFVKDGPHFSPKYSESGVPFISGRNITINGVDFTSAKYISEDLHIELSKRCKPELGDILLTKGGTTGTACVNKYDFDFNVWVHVAVLRVTDENIVNPEYLSLAFNSPDVYSQSQSYTHGVANRDLGLKRMIKICFPIPHIKEQTEIVRRVEDLFAFADKVEAQVNAAQTRVNNLTQSILAKAFRGELTQEWRAANLELISGKNSAEALLARIKSEREAIKKQPKPERSAVKKKTGSSMSKQMIKVVEALKDAGKPLSSQQLLAALNS
jgi:type I restriction enzyme S subunit